LNLRDRAEQLEMHEAIVPKLRRIRQREKIGRSGVLGQGLSSDWDIRQES